MLAASGLPFLVPPPALSRRCQARIVSAVSSRTRLGRSAAYEAARRGELPTRRVGRRLVVPVPALMRWLAGETL